MKTKEVRAKEFFERLEALYRETGLSLGHEDYWGGFILKDFTESNLQWVKDAEIDISTGEDENS